MIQLLLQRIASAIVSVFGASLIAFLLLRAVPSNPARLIAGPLASQETIDNLISQMGLDQPIYVQYGRYVWQFVRGDWGFSYSTGQPVIQQIAERLPASVELAVYSFLLAFIGAIALALLDSYTRSRWLDGVVRALSFLCVGLPPFWIALVLLAIFFEAFGWLPGPTGRGDAPSRLITGFFTIDAALLGEWSVFWGSFKSLVLPSIAMALGPLGYLMRLLRANLLDVGHEPFVVVLRAKGVPPLRTHFRHILPNAFIPTLTASGLIFAQLLGGSVLVEKVFNWPGIGAFVSDSILRQDYAVVQAFIILSAVIYIVINLCVDFLYGVIDPRIRHG